MGAFVAIHQIMTGMAKETGDGNMHLPINFSDLIAAVAMLADTFGEGLVALSMGFAALPTGLGYLLGALLVFGLGSVAVISFQVESLTVVSRIAARDWHKMCYITLLAGIIGAILGIYGAFGAIASFIEGPIISGMMVGVGIILSFVAVDLFRENRLIGGVSIALALIAYLVFIKNPNALIYALGISVVPATLLACLKPCQPVVCDQDKERLRLIPFRGLRFLTDTTVIRGALALLALRIGTSIAYVGISGQIAGITPNYDQANIITGLSGIASSLFGGAPVEPIVSVTAASPHPAPAGALLMLMMGIILLANLLPRLARHISVSSIAGYLLLVGVALTIPGNLSGVLVPGDVLSGPMAIVVTTATSDPFLGIVAGVLVRGTMHLLAAI
jgi:AGZA family xanthine/uracil permease-like MFS transporter